MGTLSKRPLRDFGVDMKRMDDFRSGAGKQSRDDGTRGHEGRLTKAIEKLTASLPSSTWLVFAGASLLGSVALKAVGRNHLSLFVGQWVPTFLIFGLYNKLVKVAGSERSAARFR
ncbi:MAG TPA: hypothetical protein VIV11_26855 [Kofleriaceae bacterium]